MLWLTYARSMWWRRSLETRARAMRADDGKFAVGWLIALVILAGAAYGAYWFLGEYGFIDRGDSTPGVTSSAEAAAAEDEDGRPVWLHGTDYELPVLIEASETRPAMYELPEWIWELDDSSWDLTVVREGDGDGQEALAERQSLVLVSPTGELFLVTDELRNDYRLSVVHWDPESNVAWMRRGGRPTAALVTELDLLTGEAERNWDGGAVATANHSEEGISNVEYLATQPDGLELWESYDAGGYSTGVFWRDGEDFVSSLASSRITRMVRQGFSEGEGVQAWFDVEGMRAVYHGVYEDAGSGKPQEEQWLIHDLSNDSFEVAEVATPNLECSPADAVRRGTFDGDLIVARCGGENYLLDPYAGAEPVAAD